MKILFHVHITRVILYLSFLFIKEKPIYKFPGEYCLNGSKQLAIEYKNSACIFFKYILFQIKCFLFFLINMC